MRRVAVTELKNRLSHYLRLVKRGIAIEVVERSVPIARIEAVPLGKADVGAHLRRLERDGLILPPRQRPRRGLLKGKPVPCQADAVAILIEQRGDL